ncbi:MAG: M23 family metallopeptidase [Terriglobia bacterium]
MRQPSVSLQRGSSRGGLTALIIVILILIALGFKLSSNPAPIIKPSPAFSGIGISRTADFLIRDPHYRIKRVTIEVRQNGHTFAAPVSLKPAPGGNAPGHAFYATAEIGRREMPGLKPGRATVVVTALNDSWGRFFRGGKAEWAHAMPVRFMPPQVEVLTTQNYINQGGSGMVLFNVSEGTTKSGVEVGQQFFPSWPVRESQRQMRLCIFAFPYDVDPKTPVHIVAEDDAGNRTIASFNYEVFPKKFRHSTIAVTDSFMQRVVPPIMSQTTAIQEQGSILKDFIAINRDLRRIDSQKLVQLSKETNPKFMWSQPFMQLPNSKVEASFADFRTYTYKGQVIDHEVHLGFDLAVVAHTPVQAANDGLVIFAGWLDIFGNAVIIDHGCGLQSLYGHMASFTVKPGQLVHRGQLIGYSDSTGLAGGDHVHFEMLLDGVPVNPAEWWDPHWVHDRIMSKLQPYLH